jgi:hypothetical protein
VGECQVREDREANVQRSSVDGRGDASNRFAESHLVGSEDSDRSVAEARIACGGGFENASDVVDRHRSHWPFAHADKTEDGERVQGPTEMVEHVVSAPVDHPRLEQGVGDAALANDRLRHPLRPVVGGWAVWPRAQEAQDADVPNARCARRGDENLRAPDMDGVIRLGPDLAVDPGAVNDGLAPIQGLLKRLSIWLGEVEAGTPGQGDYGVARGL